ncbi:MAG: M20/M25/M40 family metallo-hydrolase [Bryobacterales bacterium]|nr:M20/M25/M40 family metallo-hydrolase [Bryobacterales bacterium]
MKQTLLLLFWAVAAAQAAEPDWKPIEDRAVTFLQRYLRIQSVNPPADSREAAEFFKKELEAAGFQPKLYVTDAATGKVNLLVRLEGKDRTKKPLLLLNHFDVVPVDRKAWSVEPFEGIIKDGWIWGRGAMDMKGTGTIHLFSMLTMKAMGEKPPRDVLMLVTADEETNGTYGIRTMIRDHWADIECEYVLDEGGFGSRDMFTTGGKLAFGISVAEKQAFWLRLKAKGTAAHGSQPIAENANMILLDAIAKALALPDRGNQNEVVARMRENLQQMAANKFTNAIQKNTISLTTLTSGVGSPVKINVIPSAAEATLDCRLLPGVSSAEFLSEVKARINDPRVTVEVASDPADPGASKMDTPLFAALKKALLTQHPDAVVTPILIPYGTDSVRLRQKGVTAYGFTPMVVDAATVATMHSDEERIPVSEFKKGIRIFYELLKSDF